MLRFKMYNPLQMEYTNIATGKEKISFGLNQKEQQRLKTRELHKIKRQKRQITRAITQTMNESRGSISVSGTEKTFEISQGEMHDLVNLNTAKKIFELNLPEHGPYKIDYTRNGQYLALCGAKGHLSIIRWKDFRLISEEYFSVDADYIHDIKFAMNESMLCCAQREGVYVYNTKCVETHVLKHSMPMPLKLEYLPYHFLLCSVGHHGKLVYFDVSMGEKVATKNTKLGSCDTMTQNPRNAVIHLGHNNGTVTLWTPTNEQPVARILCHKSRVRGLAVSHSGYEMATSDDRGYLKFWDLRKFDQMLFDYKHNSMISELTYSQTGLFAFSTGKMVRIWNLKRGFKPCDVAGADEISQRHQHLYLQHFLPRRLASSLKFCPYEDVLGIGNTLGFSSIVVPGSGEPNYDLFEADPFETQKKRNNKIVHQLLDKLQPEMIQLNPDFIAAPRSRARRSERQQESEREGDKKWARKNVTRNVKNGYRGVLRKRYSKYQHMKDLHLRQEKMKSILNVRKKTKSKETKGEMAQKKERMVNFLSKKRKPVASALDRFTGPKQAEQASQIRSRWRRKAEKVHF